MITKQFKEEGQRERAPNLIESCKVPFVVIDSLDIVAFVAWLRNFWAPWTVRVQNRSVAQRWAKVSPHVKKRSQKPPRNKKKNTSAESDHLKWWARRGNRREPLRKARAHLQAAIIVRFPTTKWCSNDHEIANCCAPKKHFQKVFKYILQKLWSAEV